MELIEGGETPINSGIELASRLLSGVPALYHQLAAKVRTPVCGVWELTILRDYNMCIGIPGTIIPIPTLALRFLRLVSQFMIQRRN